MGYFTHAEWQLCLATALACSLFRLLVMSKCRECIDFYINNGVITPCYHIFLSLSLYWYFNIAIFLRVSDLTPLGSLFSSLYWSSGAGKNMFLPLRIVCWYVWSPLVLLSTAYKYFLLGGAKEFIFSLWALLSSMTGYKTLSYNFVCNFLAIVSGTTGKSFKWYN